MAKRSFTPRRPIRRAIGWFGIALALPFFVWLPAGFVPGVPNLIEVFGITGLRTPAAVTIAGLLLAAFGFHEA
ncbi:MAG: hypothetical protein GVY32_09295 [Gammaproteobacteria bacterium]|nr:hypothetical protein [Gammaproteobacteria bacterium]